MAGAVRRKPVVRAVAILGLGAVGSKLALELARSGIPVIAWNRTPRGLPQSAPEIRVVPTLAEAMGAAKEAVLCVADGGLVELDAQLAELGDSLRPTTVLHTCGARPPGVLSKLEASGCATGLFHPLLSVPTGGVVTLRNARFAVRGAPAARALAARLAAQLGAQTFELEGDDRAQARYHAAASLVSGGTAAVIASGLELARDAFQDPSEARLALAALARSVADNLDILDPEEAATGPIPRGSVELVQQHLAALEGPERAVYAQVAGLVLKLVAPRLDASAEKLLALAIEQRK